MQPRSAGPGLLWRLLARRVLACHDLKMTRTIRFCSIPSNPIQSARLYNLRHDPRSPPHSFHDLPPVHIHVHVPIHTSHFTCAYLMPFRLTYARARAARSLLRPSHFIWFFFHRDHHFLAARCTYRTPFAPARPAAPSCPSAPACESSCPDCAAGPCVNDPSLNAMPCLWCVHACVSDGASAGCKAEDSRCKVRRRIAFSSRRPRYKTQDIGHKTQDTGYKIQPPRREASAGRNAYCKMQDE